MVLVEDDFIDEFLAELQVLKIKFTYVVKESKNKTKIKSDICKS